MPSMLARGIRSYHRPTRMEEALTLAGQGIVPVAGGTRIFAASREVPNVLDLSALSLGRLEMEDGDLRIGAMVSLQDLIDAPVTQAASTGLLPAAARVEGSSGDEAAVQRCLDQIEARAPFRDDAHASASYRGQAALVLTRRALVRAIAQARGAVPAAPSRPRPRPPVPLRLATELPYFTSGTVEMWANGERRKAHAEARTTLLDLLREQGLRGVKHGCETGEC